MVFPTERQKNIGQAQKLIVSVNPKAGARSSKSSVEELVDLLQAADLEVTVTSDIDQVASQSEEWMSTDQLRAVVAAGGDGTASLVAEKTARGTPIALLPQGTENLLSKYLKIKPDPKSVSELILQGDLIELDAGRANGRLFLIMLGCGFDAEVVRRLDETRSGHINHLTYAKPILQSIFSYDYPEIQIDDFSESGHPLSADAKWAFVINLPRYAVGLQIAPKALGTDEQLDLCAFREGSFLSGLTYLTGILLGQHESWQPVVNATFSTL